jgi:hypothetical protein
VIVTATAEVTTRWAVAPALSLDLDLEGHLAAGPGAEL